MLSRFPYLMKRHVLIFGMVGGILIAVLEWTEYRFLVLEHSVEIYGGLIAATFAGVGIWLGNRVTRRKERVVVREVPVEVAVIKEVLVRVPAEAPPTLAQGSSALHEPFIPDERKREELGVTRRELDILELIARGFSNREIAGKLFVSENTVKTHSSRVFDKLGAKRRTQAVQLGKEFGLLP
ncbi:MAG TPA: response regulator transcription factor [Terriglobales bacterium]|nr:response regulator transcription factor [Terriglobales bacterium]